MGSLNQTPPSLSDGVAPESNPSSLCPMVWPLNQTLLSLSDGVAPKANPLISDVVAPEANHSFTRAIQPLSGVLLTVFTVLQPSNLVLSRTINQSPDQSTIKVHPQAKGFAQRSNDYVEERAKGT